MEQSSSCPGLTQKEYISVRVQNPTIHNTYDEGRYTTFEVYLQTNSLSFASKHSVVERRYSDFQWLRKTLAKTTDVKPPSLPFGRLFGTFSESYLKERQTVLTDFLQKVVRETLFLSSTALHLFLQTRLTRGEMDVILKDVRRGGSMDSIARAISQFGARCPSVSSQLSDMSPINSDSKRSMDGDSMAVSRSVPSLTYGHGSWMHSSGSVGNGVNVSRSFGYGRSSSESSSSGGSSTSNSYSNLHGNSLRIDNNNDGKSDDWVLLDPPSPDSKASDVIDEVDGNDVIDSAAYTNVTWEIGEIEPTSSERPSWNEFQMSKFINGNTDPMSVPSSQRLSLDNKFKPRSFDSAVNSYYNSHGKQANCRHTLKVRSAMNIRRAASDTNIQRNDLLSCSEGSPPHDHASDQSDLPSLLNIEAFDLDNDDDKTKTGDTKSHIVSVEVNQTKSEENSISSNTSEATTEATSVNVAVSTANAAETTSITNVAEKNSMANAAYIDDSGSAEAIDVKSTSDEAIELPKPVSPIIQPDGNEVESAETGSCEVYEKLEEFLPTREEASSATKNPMNVPLFNDLFKQNVVLLRRNSEPLPIHTLLSNLTRTKSLHSIVMQHKSTNFQKTIDDGTIDNSFDSGMHSGEYNDSGVVIVVENSPRQIENES